MKKILSILSFALILIPTLASAQIGGADFSDPAYIVLTPGFPNDPMVLSYRAGGGDDAANYDYLNESAEACIGYINTVPDHTLTLTDSFDNLRVSINSTEDTTLLIWVQNTGQVYCYDDQNGLSPEVSGPWAAGTYEIYVGTFYQGGTDYPEYTIAFSEF